MDILRRKKAFTKFNVPISNHSRKSVIVLIIMYSEFSLINRDKTKIHCTSKQMLITEEFILIDNFT